MSCSDIPHRIISSSTCSGLCAYHEITHCSFTAKTFNILTLNPLIKMKKISFYCLLLIATLTTQAQWASINPGAGGQVQDIVCDPNQPNRLILASDMEGIYESTNNGNSWNHKGHLHQNRVYAVAIPKSSNQTHKDKMYVGTLYGLEVSNNRGQDFTLITSTKKLSIGAIAVHPSNPSIVLAGIGWKDDYDFSHKFGLSPDKSGKGKGEIFRSTNAGAAWTKIEFDGKYCNR